MISTGTLPAYDVVEDLVHEAHQRFSADTDGVVADYIPVLAQVDPDQFGIAVVSATGEVHTAGDAEVPFSIQSISKAFVFGLVCHAIGHEAVRAAVGVNATGLSFDSVMAVELHQGSPMNPMVNAGALATTSLVPGDTAWQRWERVLEGLSKFAGRDLEMDETVFASEMETNQRNRGIARLLESYGRLTDVEGTVEVYTRQCSVLVTAVDLAVMGATLADGGVNPVTGVRVLDPAECRRVLTVMATAGLYERSGDWLYDIGMPGKSGVSGGMVTVAPGKGALGTFSPRLDQATACAARWSPVSWPTRPGWTSSAPNRSRATTPEGQSDTPTSWQDCSHRRRARSSSLAAVADFAALRFS